jgi:hypothetical protein
MSQEIETAIAGKAIGRSIYFELADPIYPWFESFEYKLTKTP